MSKLSVLPVEALEGLPLASAEVTGNPRTPFLMSQGSSWNVELDGKANTSVLEGSAGLISPNRRLAVVPVIQLYSTGSNAS